MIPRSHPHTYARDVLLTALAPLIWGSTYMVTTSFLPHVPPITVALLRALPAGLLLLAAVRRLPQGIWWLRVFILGALNFSLFWSMLFISAYRLPGGAAATVGAVQPLVVVFLSAALLGSRIRAPALLGALMGLAGVALLVLTPGAALDGTGVAAGLAGAASMAAGTVLSRKWRPPVPLLTFTAWQLTAGGILLVPLAFLAGIELPAPTQDHLIALGWLSLVGAALTYVLWFHGIARLEPSVVASLGFLSPVTAIVLGWMFLGQMLTGIQGAGVLLILGGIWVGQQNA